MLEGNELWMVVGRYNVGRMHHTHGVNLLGKWDIGRSGACGRSLPLLLTVMVRRRYDKHSLDLRLQLRGGNFAIPLLDLREGIIKLGLPFCYLSLEDGDEISLTLATCRGRFAIGRPTEPSSGSSRYRLLGTKRGKGNARGPFAVDGDW